jgi:hypothetical protein
MWAKDFGVSLATGKMSDARRRGASEGNAADDILTVDQGLSPRLTPDDPSYYI